MKESHNPLLVNARGYRVVEDRCDGTCDCEPGLYTLRNVKRDDRRDESWWLSDGRPDDSLELEFELMFEVDRVPRRKLPAPAGFGRKEIIARTRLLLRADSDPVRRPAPDPSLRQSASADRRSGVPLEPALSPEGVL